MRTWLKPFLLTLTVLLGGSALWVWAAALTGNVGKAVVLTETNGFDIGGIIRANTFGLHQLGGDPTTGADWLLYAKSTGVHVRDPSGNVTGPFGTGSGGGSAAMTVARVATTASITLSGEQTIDGVATSASVVLVKDQSTGTQNGLYVSASSAWTRSTSFDTSAEFTAGFPVYVQSGTLNGGTVWNFSVIGTFTLGSTNATFVRTGLGNLGELLSNKNAASGYAGLTSAIKQVWTQRGDAATHAPINLTGQITPTASTMRVSGSGTPPVTMTSGNPRILGCTTSADDGKELTIEGSDATNTLTMPTGNGVQLCGNTGNIVFGLNLGRARFICDGIPTPKVWRQADCPTLQTVANVGRTIVADETTPVIIANAAGTGRFERYVDSSTGKPTDRAICSGAACPTTELTNPQFVASGSKPTCDATTRGLRWDTLGGAGVADVFEVCQKSVTDTYAWMAPSASATRTTTIPLRLDTVTFSDANAFISAQDRAFYDTNVVEFVDAVTGCVFFKTHVPANLAPTPAWNVSIWHSALSGTGGDVVLTLDAKTYATNVAKDAAFTSLTLPSSGVVAVSTSANTTLTTLGVTNFDGILALSANTLLRLKLCRTGGSGSDSLGVSWLLESIQLRVDVN